MAGRMGAPGLGHLHHYEKLLNYVHTLAPIFRTKTKEVTIVIADQTNPGTRLVLGADKGNVNVYGILGHGQTELVVVDTSNRLVF